MAVAHGQLVSPHVLAALRREAHTRGWARLAKEVDRARERHGRGIELTSSEVHALAGAVLPPLAAKFIREMKLKIDAAEDYERRREERLRPMRTRRVGRLENL